MIANWLSRSASKGPIREAIWRWWVSAPDWVEAGATHAIDFVAGKEWSVVSGRRSFPANPNGLLVTEGDMVEYDSEIGHVTVYPGAAMHSIVTYDHAKSDDELRDMTKPR